MTRAALVANERQRVGPVASSMRVAVMFTVTTTLLVGCGSNSAEHSSGSESTVPFPSDTDTYSIGNIIEIDEDYADYGWAGRRSSDDANTTLMLRATAPGASSDPVFVSYPTPAYYDEIGDQWAESLVVGRETTEVGGRTSFRMETAAAGVPQDVPASRVVDPLGTFTIAQRNANDEALTAFAEQLMVGDDRSVTLADDAELKPIGRLDPEWTTSEDAVLVGLWDESGTGENTVVTLRGISESEGRVLVGLANRDPEESLRTEDSVEADETFEKPVTRNIGGSEATIATLTPGIRSVVNPDAGYALFTAGNGISTSFVSTDRLVDLAAEIEMVDGDEFLERQADAQRRNMARALESEESRYESFDSPSPLESRVWDTTLADGSALSLHDMAEVTEQGVPQDLRSDVYIRYFNPAEHFFDSTTVALQNERTSGAMAGVVSASDDVHLIVGVMPAGVVTVNGSMDDATATVDAMATGLETHPTVFMMRMQSNRFPVEQHFTVIGIGEDGSEIARIEPSGS